MILSNKRSECNKYGKPVLICMSKSSACELLRERGVPQMHDSATGILSERGPMVAVTKNHGSVTDRTNSNIKRGIKATDGKEMYCVARCCWSKSAYSPRETRSSLALGRF